MGDIKSKETNDMTRNKTTRDEMKRDRREEGVKETYRNTGEVELPEVMWRCDFGVSWHPGNTNLSLFNQRNFLIHRCEWRG